MGSILVAPGAVLRHRHPLARARGRASAWVRVLALAAAACAMALVVAPGASAGQYDVAGCDAAPGGVNNSWIPGPGGAGWGNSVALCPTWDNGMWGGHAWAIGTPSTQGYFTGVGQYFWSPAGTTILGLTVRDLYYIPGLCGNSCPPSAYFAGLTANPGNNLLAGCPIQATECLVGTGVTGGAVWRAAPAGTTQLDFAVSCWSNPTCSTANNGFGMSVMAAFYYTIVRINDATSPTVTGVAGDPLADTVNWRRGTVSTTFDAADATNIRYTRLLVDGATVQTTWESCYSGGVRNATRYTYPTPCVGDVANRTYSVDTTAHASGSHTVSVRAGDSTDISANLGTSGNFSVRWDNTLPVAPASIADGAGADQQWSTSASTLAANWPAGSDLHSGVQDYRICFSTAVSCGGTVVSDSHVAATSRAVGSLSLTEGATYRACVRTRDAAQDQSGAVGNVSAWRCSDGVTVDTVAPTAPTGPSDGGGSDIDWQSSTTTIEAGWGASTDATSGVVGYDYCISTAASCGGTVVVGWTDAGPATTLTHGGLALAPGATYHVSLRARDAAGHVSSVVSTDGVTVDTSAPNVPVLQSPPAGSAHATWPVLVATYDDVPLASPGQIEFEACSDPGCGATVHQGASGPALADGTDGSWTPAIADGSWWWRARAVDGAGNASAWTGTRAVQVGVFTLAVAVDAPSVDGGVALPGEPMLASTLLTVSSNAITGYALLAQDESDTIGLDGPGGGVPDWSGTVAAPSVWPAGVAGAFGVSVRDATGGRLAKWGTAGGPWPQDDFAANRYAGLTTTPQLLHQRSGFDPGDDTVELLHRLVAGPAHGGSYSTQLTFTVVANP